MSIIDNLRLKTQSFIKHQSGISMIEFGLLLPIFVLLLFGIIDIFPLLSYASKNG